MVCIKSPELICPAGISFQVQILFNADPACHQISPILVENLHPVIKLRLCDVLTKKSREFCPLDGLDTVLDHEAAELLFYGIHIYFSISKVDHSCSVFLYEWIDIRKKMQIIIFTGGGQKPDTFIR